MGPRTLESFMIQKGRKGQVFYSEKPDKDLTALSSVYGRKILTERFISVNIKSLKANSITKVTLL